MSTINVNNIIEQIKALPLPQQIEVAEVVDRLTWAQRWRSICERVELRLQDRSSTPDEEIDKLVGMVRRERPLSERS